MLTAKLNCRWFPVSRLYFRIVVLCLLTHLRNIRAYWINTISDSCDFPVIRRQFISYGKRAKCWRTHPQMMNWEFLLNTYTKTVSPYDKVFFRKKCHKYLALCWGNKPVLNICEWERHVKLSHHLPGLLHGSRTAAKQTFSSRIFLNAFPQAQTIMLPPPCFADWIISSLECFFYSRHSASYFKLKLRYFASPAHIPFLSPAAFWLVYMVFGKQIHFVWHFPCCPAIHTILF